MSLLGSLLARSRESAVSLRPRQRSVFEAWPADPVTGGPPPGAFGEGPQARRAPAENRPSQASTPGPGASDSSLAGPRPTMQARTPAGELEDVTAPESYRSAVRPTGQPTLPSAPPPRSGSTEEARASRQSGPARPPEGDRPARSASAHQRATPPQPPAGRPARPPEAGEPASPAPRPGPTLSAREGLENRSIPAAIPEPSGTRPHASLRPAPPTDGRDGPGDAARAEGADPAHRPGPPTQPRATDRRDPEPTLPPAPGRPGATASPARPFEPRPQEPHHPSGRPAPTLRPRRLEAPPAPQAPEGPPPIHVSIGRVEVRAVRPQPRPTPSVETPPPMVSLEDYLGRGGRPT